MFQLFLLFFVIKTINQYVDKEGDNLNALQEDSLQNNNVLQNYSAIVFHLSMTIVIIFSFLNPLILSEEKVSALIRDGFFQFFSTLLIAIIGIINPFTTFTETFKQRLEESAQTFPDAKIIDWVLMGKNWQLLKIGLSLIIIFYFYQSGFLFLPKLDQGLISGVIVFFITMFIFSSVIQLIKNPVVFKKQVLFRVNYLFKSIKRSFFISILVIIVVFLASALLGVESYELIKFESIALLVYNVVMTFNEYKILKLKKSSDVSSALSQL